MSKLLTLNFTILLYLVLFSSCATVSSRVEPPLQVVSRVDINKYLGRWYEIGRYPNWFQENCYSVTADYELSSDGFIKVINRCKDRELNGEIREAMGIAYISDTKTNAKLKVSFHWPFYGDYWIGENSPRSGYRDNWRRNNGPANSNGQGRGRTCQNGPSKKLPLPRISRPSGRPARTQRPFRTVPCTERNHFTKKSATSPRSMARKTNCRNSGED
mgnify:CR=1 FL=1